MPDLSHLWQRFLLATALVFGLALGVGATVFGYSNTAPVNIGWSIFHLDGIPLWTVALVPLVIVLVAGTVYHWFNSLHHFTEHMRHRRRVHELEAEVKSLRAHLDQLLEMPDHASTGKTLAMAEPTTMEAPALPAPAAANGEDKTARKSRRKAAVSVDAQSEQTATASSVVEEPAANGADKAVDEPVEEAPATA